MFGNYVRRDSMELVVRVNRHLVFSSNPLFSSWRKIREGIEERIHIPFWCDFEWKIIGQIMMNGKVFIFY
jgi:hypothetical protein